MKAQPPFVMAPTKALRRLADFLESTGTKLTVEQAATLAIDEWIAIARGQYTRVKPSPTRGYFWKTLFLPEGTELRMDVAGETHHAHVEGDQLIHQGRPVSPRQMAIAIGGEGRNAWREMRVLLPGAPRWFPAERLRREAGQATAPEPVSPFDAMNAAAACMSETLKTALALVDHAKEQSIPKFERRNERKRRAQDLLDDSCQFD